MLCPRPTLLAQFCRQMLSVTEEEARTSISAILGCGLGKVEHRDRRTLWTRGQPACIWHLPMLYPGIMALISSGIKTLECLRGVFVCVCADVWCGKRLQETLTFTSHSRRSSKKHLRCRRCKSWSRSGRDLPVMGVIKRRRSSRGCGDNGVGVAEESLSCFRGSRSFLVCGWPLAGSLNTRLSYCQYFQETFAVILVGFQAHPAFLQVFRATLKLLCDQSSSRAMVSKGQPTVQLRDYGRGPGLPRLQLHHAVDVGEASATQDLRNGR